jgi:phage-related protein
MADGKVVIQVDMDGNKAQSGVERLKSMMGGLAESGERVGSVFKSVLGANIVSGALISGIQSLGSAIKGVFATALDEGAKLQQSFGGVDTLYTTAAESVKQYANAAASAGISANTYAEQAVSFGASLKQALGGDAVKAAQMADKAIMAMADNSAKMGTDIGSIQQTFQGFAKQNYTMLDNLKLGYGGTKEEMQRLLKDASKLEKAMGKKFDINNFADIVEAIDLVQQELGVAGVAAEEARTTFSGSFAAMKASASNFLANLTLGEDIGPSLKALISSTSTFLLGNFLPMVGNIMRQLPQAIDTALAEAGPKIEQGFKSLFASFGVDEGVFDVIKNVYQAFKDLTDAALDLAIKLGDAIPWDIVGAATGHVVNAISMIVSWISKLTQSISADIWRGLIAGIGGALVAFKTFNFLKSFNPFGLFAKGVKEGADEVVKGATSSKSAIAQIFKSISTLIKTTGTAIKTAATGIGEGIKIALSGLAPVIRAFGLALRTAGIGNILALGGAIGIAAVGIGAGVAIIAAGLSLIASQGEGVATIINAVGQAFATVATAIISTFAQAIVTVSGVLPNVTSALAQLSPLVVAFGEAMGAAAPFITALGEAISGIATAVTPIVEIISDAFVSVVQIIADAIVQIVEAIAPFAPAITEMVVAIAPSIADIVSSFSSMFSQISLIIDSLSNLLKTFGEQVSSILKSAGSVVESFGSAIRNVLDGVAGIFDSIGNAALNAGLGVKYMAEGISMLTELGLLDLAGTLATVATGLTAIANSGIASAGPGLQQAGTGLSLIAISAQLASVALQSLPTALSSLSTNLSTLPETLTSAGTSMSTFATSVMASFASLSGSVSGVMALQTGLVALANAMMMAQSGASAMSSTLTMINASASSATSAISQLASGMASAMTQAVSSVQSNMALIVTVILQSSIQMTQAGQQAGRGVSEGITNGIRSGVGSATSAMSSMVNSIQSTGMRGVSTMRYVGDMIGQGLAQGMYSALGAVTAAANALVAQAERAAQAKAKINSPSRRFRDNVGRFISQGVAVGILADAHKVDDAMGDVFDQIKAFNFAPEDILGVGQASLTKTLQVKSDLDRQIKASVKVVQEKSNRLVEQALEVAEKAVKRPVSLMMESGALVGQIGQKMTDYQNDQLIIDNMMRGII